MRSCAGRRYLRNCSRKSHRMGIQLFRSQGQLFVRIPGRKGQRYAGMG